MTGEDILSALALPPTTTVDKRVPKTLLTEHAAVTAADKRRIKDGIERIQWLAALKPDTIGVAAYRDEAREYLEIAVLRLVIRPEATWPRLVELLHRAIPYPALLLIEQAEQPPAEHSMDSLPYLSLAHKRWSLGEKDKMVLDGDAVTVPMPNAEEACAAPFADALCLSHQPHTSMRALYQGWMDTVLAHQAARRTGHFALLNRTERRTARADALKTCERLDATIIQLRAAARKEKQMARQVALNLELQQAQAERAAALDQL